MGRLRADAAARSAAAERPAWRRPAEGRSDPLRPGQLQGARRRLCGGLVRSNWPPGVAPMRVGTICAAAERARDQAITVTCATDGNHGRAVAWGAQRFHCRCVIFVHETRQPGPGGRDRALRRRGASRVRGTYDDAVREAARQAEANGWFVVSDTSWPGYTEVPRDDHAGLPADGGRGGRSVDRSAADACVHPGRRRRCGGRGLGADAGAVSSGADC